MKETGGIRELSVDAGAEMFGGLGWLEADRCSVEAQIECAALLLVRRLTLWASLPKRGVEERGRLELVRMIHEGATELEVLAKGIGRWADIRIVKYERRPAAGDNG